MKAISGSDHDSFVYFHGGPMSMNMERAKETHPEGYGKMSCY